MSETENDLDKMREELGDFMTPMADVQRIGDALVAEILALRKENRRLSNTLDVVTRIKDGLLERGYADRPEVPHP